MYTRLLCAAAVLFASLPSLAFTTTATNDAGIAAPSLTAPADGGTLSSLGPTLRWTNPSGVNQYHLQVIPANNDGPGIDLHLTSSDSSFTIPAPPQWYGLLPDMTYTWRLRVSDAAGFIDLIDASWSSWAQRRFHTPAAGSNTISAVFPTPGSNVTGTPVLQWANSRQDVFYYEVQVSSDQRFNTDPRTSTASVFWELRHGGATNPVNSYTIPAGVLQPGVTYYWRVRPRIQGDGRPVSWTAPFSFTVSAPAQTFRAEGPDRPVLAQYYAWYDTDTWGPSSTADSPRVPYNSDDSSVIGRQVRDARNAGIDALALSWLGPNDRRTDGNLQKLLASGAQQGLWATVTFETDKPQFGSQSDVVAGLRYLQQKYASQPNWLKYQGKPVFLFWQPSQVARSGGQSALAAWASIRIQVYPNPKAVWIMEGLDYNLLEVFDGMFGYSLAWSTNVNYTLSSWAQRVHAKADQLGQSKIFMATVMPGYDDTRVRPAPEGFARDREAGGYLAATWDAAINAGADWVNLTSFNEWIEGSQIEPSASYGDQYVNINREWSDRFKGG